MMISQGALFSVEARLSLLQGWNEFTGFLVQTCYKRHEFLMNIHNPHEVIHITTVVQEFNFYEQFDSHRSSLSVLHWLRKIAALNFYYLRFSQRSLWRVVSPCCYIPEDRLFIALNFIVCNEYALTCITELLKNTKIYLAYGNY